MKAIGPVDISQLKSLAIMNSHLSRKCQITTLLWGNTTDCWSRVWHKSEAHEEQPSYLYMPPTLIMTTIQFYPQDKLEKLQHCFIS